MATLQTEPTLNPLASTSSSTLGSMQDIEGADLPSSQGATGMDLEKDTNSPPSVPVTPARNPADDIVDFDGPDDPHNPQNWSKKKKWRVTAAMGGMTFVVTFASSIYVSSAANRPLVGSN